MDGGDLGVERKLYCRELVARFGYHLALNWNMGEETRLSTEQLQAMASYLHRVDPYKHNLVVHTFPGQYDRVYGPLLGDKSDLTGLSIQTNRADFAAVHDVVKTWVRRSEQAGKKWVVACDEPGDASHGLVPDMDDPTRENARKNALWGTLLAGGSGVEWYFGYKHDHSDLTCQDWRSRNRMWDQSRHAIGFFRQYEVPFWTMSAQDELSKTDNWILASPADAPEFHLVAQVVGGGKCKIELPAGDFGFGWFDPRLGHGLYSSGKIGGGGVREFSAPGIRDWILLIGPPAKIQEYAIAQKPVALMAPIVTVQPVKKRSENGVWSGSPDPRRNGRTKVSPMSRDLRSSR
jgi:hypothetical protein